MNTTTQIKRIMANWPCAPQRFQARQLERGREKNARVVFCVCWFGQSHSVYMFVSHIFTFRASQPRSVCTKLVLPLNFEYWHSMPSFVYKRNVRSEWSKRKKKMSNKHVDMMRTCLIESTPFGKFDDFGEDGLRAGQRQHSTGDPFMVSANQSMLSD